MLGKRIRQHRQARKMTLAQVAERVGVSAGSLSQIERGIISPSMETFRKIAMALDVPPFVLLIESPKESLVIRKSDRRAFLSDGVRMEIVTTGLHPGFEMLSVTLDPGCALGELAIDYGRGESMIVVRGSVQAQIGDDTFQLEEGDSIYFPPGFIHNVLNIGEGEAEMITVTEKAMVPD